MTRWDKHAVRALRKQRNETQDQFADALGVARSTVIDWEKGGTISLMGEGALDRIAATPLGAATLFDHDRLVGQAETIATMLRSALQGQEALIAALRADLVTPRPADPEAAAGEIPVVPRRRKGSG